MNPSGSSSMSSSTPTVEPESALLQQIRSLGFDAIRYASYRTAAKLRFIQRETLGESPIHFTTINNEIMKRETRDGDFNCFLSSQLTSLTFGI